jgi:hypothetical protein
MTPKLGLPLTATVVEIANTDARVPANGDSTPLIWNDPAQSKVAPRHGHRVFLKWRPLSWQTGDPDHFVPHTDRRF